MTIQQKLRSLVVLFAACGDAPTPDANSPDALWERLVACALTGEFRADAHAASSCSAWPLEGEAVSIARDGDLISLRMGTVELPIVEVTGCEAVAAGCSATPADSMTEPRYFAPRVRIVATDSGLELGAEADDVVGAPRGRTGACDSDDELVLAAHRIAACDPEGVFVAAAPANHTGACDLDWAAGTVTIARDPSDGTFALDWAGTTLSGLTLSQTDCSLRGAKGTASSIWLYNNAARSATVQLSIGAEGLSGTVMDALQGETFEGETCAGATFSLEARRPSRLRQPLAVACELPRPAICGDATCEPGESCQCAECACASGAECGVDEICRATCTLASEATACMAGQRCGLLDETTRPLAVLPSDDLYCVAAGVGVQGDSCDRNSQCGAGLLCHIAVGAWAAECAPPCGADFPACGGGRVCGPLGEGEGRLGSNLSAIRACEREVADGQDCYSAGCVDGSYCVKQCVNNDPCSYTCKAF